MSVQLNVLVAEDDAVSLKVLSDILLKAGHDVFTARNGHEALDLFRKSEIDIVICDMVMPGADGFEVIAGVKAAKPTVPVIAISGGSPRFSSENLMSMASKLGATKVLQKPFSGSELNDAITELLTQ